MEKRKMKVINQSTTKSYALYHADCVDAVKGLPDNSIDYSITSPPFSSLYVYSNSTRDMGNSSSDDEFYKHYQFLIKELYRVLKPGRLLSFHCMNLPTSKQNDGVIGIKDFRGDLIRAYQSEGFIYHSEVVIFKDPVIAMMRTKALGLLHKQLVKDSSMSRHGIPDYLITMRKPGANNEPIQGKLDRYYGDPSKAPSNSKDETRTSIDIWQRYASPSYEDIITRYERIIPTLNPEQLEVFNQILWMQFSGKQQQLWTDIDPSKTLQAKSARADEDERHICPLQLQVIERAIQLWSNPGDTVLDPFNGIGSSGVVALEMGRKYIGVELKESYYQQAKLNLELAASKKNQLSLFDV
jgi:DNA modification methylase